MLSEEFSEEDSIGRKKYEFKSDLKNYHVCGCCLYTINKFLYEWV